MKTKPKQRRGFAAMPREQVLSIASQGGLAMAKRKGWLAKIGKIGGQRSGEVRQQRKIEALDRKVKKLEKRHVRDVT